VQYFTHQFSFTTRQVLNNIVSYERNKQVQQTNLFNLQTLLFHFQHIIQIHFNTYLIYQQVSECLVGLHKTMLVVARSVLLSNTFSTTSKFLTPNMYWRSRKAMYTGCISGWKAFCAMSPSVYSKRITACFFSNVAVFNVCKWHLGEVIIIKLTYGNLRQY